MVEIARTFTKAALSRITSGTEGAKLIGANVAGYASTHVQGLLSDIAASLSTHITDPVKHDLYGSLSGRPATVASGTRYWAYDTNQLFRSTGSGWLEILLQDQTITNLQGDVASLQNANDPVANFTSKDDFASGLTSNGNIGDWGWNFNATNSGTVSKVAGELNHPGIIRLDSAAVAGALISLFPNSTPGTGLFDVAAMFDIIWIFRVNQTDANTMMRLGVSGNPTNNPDNNGVWLTKSYAETNWKFVSYVGGVEKARVDSGVTVATGWVKVRIRRTSATTVAYSLNGGAETVVSGSANLPTGAVQPFAQVQAQTASAKTMDLDLFTRSISGLVR